MAIKTQTIGLKENMIQPTQGFGTEVLAVPSYLREQAVLNTEGTSELVRLVLVIEEWYGAPQDIEWALDANGFFILQSRPVTGLPRPGG